MFEPRLVDAESAHEAGHGGSHAVARIRVDAVGAEAGLHQLDGGITLPYRPLAGTEHGDTVRALGRLFQRGLDLFGHDVKGGIPGDRGEFAVLVELSVLHAQQGLGQPVLAVHDLGKEIALDAIQALVHRRVGVALGGHHPTVLDSDQHPATGAAIAADALVPAHAFLALRHGRNRDAGNAHAGAGGRGGNGVGLDEFTSRQLHFGSPFSCTAG
jgi:hypothetical protein